MPAQVLAQELRSSWPVLAVSLSYVSVVDVFVVDSIVVVIGVSGASSGIGSGTAIQLAGAGCQLAIHGRNKENLEKVAQQCQEKGLPAEKVCHRIHPTRALLNVLSAQNGVS